MNSISFKRNLKLIVLLCFIAITLFSCKNEKLVVVSGELSNAYPTKLYISEFKLVSNKIIDSVEIKADGKFKFKIRTSEPCFFQIKTSESNFILILAEPGERIKIAANMQRLNFDYAVSGSKSSHEVKVLTDKLNFTKASLDSLVSIADKNQDQPGYKELLTRLDSQYVEIVKAQRRFSIQFLLDHLKSMSSIVALYQQIDKNTYVLNQNRDLQYIKIVSDSLRKYYPNSDVVKILYTDRSRLLTELNRLKFNAAAQNVPVTKFPDLTLQTDAGDTMKLSRVKGKLIILNFWAPENEESLYVIKGLQEIYRKHQKSGLEIYNVGLMRDTRNWKSIITKFDFPGIQVIDDNAAHAYSLRIYNVKQLPANYLINESGIVASNIFGESLDVKVSQLLR